MIWLTEAAYLDNYRVQVRFNDGMLGIVDLKDTIFGDHRPIFRPLRDIDYFKRFRIEGDTLTWENGLDLAPEYLYEKATSMLKGALRGATVSEEDYRRHLEDKYQ